MCCICNQQVNHPHVKLQQRLPDTDEMADLSWCILCIDWSYLFLQLPAPGRLAAVGDCALQEGSGPAVLSAFTHRQPERVGWRGGKQIAPVGWIIKNMPEAELCWEIRADRNLLSLRSCCSTWTKRFSRWWSRLSSTRGKVSLSHRWSDVKVDLQDFKRRRVRHVLSSQNIWATLTYCWQLLKR